tara:strand:+ start:9351 stop:10106 length:756 start_codon:yes stop_codon:yes gene_type:complete
MSQHDYNIANQTFPNTRTDFNSVFGAISTKNSGATEPTTTAVYLPWADTAASLMKFRNAADSDWITWATTDGKLLSADGSEATPGMAFSSDVNTGAFRPTTDIYAISTGGTEAVRWDASQNMALAGVASLVADASTAPASTLTCVTTGTSATSVCRYIHTGKFVGTTGAFITTVSRGGGDFTVSVRLSSSNVRTEMYIVTLREDGTTIAQTAVANTGGSVGATFSVVAGNIKVTTTSGSNGHDCIGRWTSY